jgi:hypothetical protein
MYQDVSCPWSEYSSMDQKLLDKNPNLNVVSERPMDYNYENKKIFKELFKIYDNFDFFVVKHIHLNPNQNIKESICNNIKKKISFLILFYFILLIFHFNF